MKLLLANPRRKRRAKKTHAKKTVITVKSNPRRKRSSALSRFAKLRRNPRRRGGLRGFAGRAGSSAVATAKTGAIAGLGALGADIIAAQINKFLPASIQSGPMQQITQAGVAIAAGMLVQKFVSKDVGHAIAIGGVTVATYNLGRSLLAGKGIPGLAGDDGLLAYDLSGDDGLLAYTDEEDEFYDMAAYTNGAPIV